MALPKQIQRQADALKALEEAQAQQPVAADPTPAPEPEGSEPEAQSPPVVADPPATAPAAPAPAVQPSLPADDPPELWKQRFHTLQGMFNAQVPMLQEQVKALKDELSTLKAAASTTPAKPETGKRVTLVTPEEEDAFGKDLIDVMRRTARGEVAEEISSLRDTIAALQQQLGKEVGEVRQVTEAEREQRFYDKLTQALPTWRTVQATAECQAWLGQRMPGTTMTWEDVLLDAAQKRDVQRASEVFNTFLAAYPQHRPQPPAPQPKAPKPELTRQVAPAKSNSASGTSVSSEKRMFSSAEYAAESMNVVRLRKAGKLDEAQRLENELNVALQENRVTP